MKHIWMVEDKVGADGRQTSEWTKIGVAFENADGSTSINLAAVPVSGRMIIRDAMEAPPAASAGEQAAKNREAFERDVNARASVKSKLVRDAQFSEENDATPRRFEK